MAIKLSQNQLPHLQDWLENHLPHSFKLRHVQPLPAVLRKQTVLSCHRATYQRRHRTAAGVLWCPFLAVLVLIQVHGELKSHLRGQFPDVDFFVDRWPHPQAVVARVDPAGERVQCPEFYSSMVQGCCAVTDEALCRLFTDPRVVDWSTRTVFSAISVKHVPLLKRVANSMRKSAVAYRVNVVLKAASHHLQPLPVPDGMKLRRISSADIEHINSTWKFATKGSEAHIVELVQRFPSVCLATESGQHVGHMVGTSYGTMGMLYVNPDFRRKGYGKVIVSQLAQKYFEQGEEDAYVFIEEGNLPSVNLHQSLGFRIESGVKLVWVRCSPQDF